MGAEASSALGACAPSCSPAADSCATSCAAAAAATSLPRQSCANSSVQCGDKHCLLTRLDWDPDAVADWALIHASASGDTQKIQDALEAGAHVDTTRSLSIRAYPSRRRPPRAKCPDEFAEVEVHNEFVQLSGTGAYARQPSRVLNLTPLMHAAREGHHKAVAVLLEAGAVVHLRDQDGMQPLHFAARAGCAACCELLIAAGAEPHSLDDSGWDALAFVPRDSLFLRAEREVWEQLLGRSLHTRHCGAEAGSSCTDVDSEPSTATPGVSPTLPRAAFPQHASRCVSTHDHFSDKLLDDASPSDVCNGSDCDVLGPPSSLPFVLRGLMSTSPRLDP